MTSCRSIAFFPPHLRPKWPTFYSESMTPDSGLFSNEKHLPCIHSIKPVKIILNVNGDLVS